MGKSPVRVIDDKIVVELQDQKVEKTKAGIIIPDSMQDNMIKLLKGTIVATGDGVKDQIEMKVKVGEVIAFTKNAGTQIEVGDKQYMIMRQAEIAYIVI